MALNKACCATCVGLIRFHEIMPRDAGSGTLIYCGNMVGVSKTPSDGRSTRFYCVDHVDRREGL